MNYLMVSPLKSSTSPNLMISLQQTDNCVFFPNLEELKKPLVDFLTNTFPDMSMKVCFTFSAALVLFYENKLREVGKEHHKKIYVLWCCERLAQQAASLTLPHSCSRQTGRCPQISEEKRLSLSGPTVSASQSRETTSWPGRGCMAARWTTPDGRA